MKIGVLIVDDLINIIPVKLNSNWRIGSEQILFCTCIMANQNLSTMFLSDQARGEIDDEDVLKIAKEVNNKQNNITKQPLINFSY